jgi:glycosyltransferase involved in cell wall biosynthesis
MKVAIVHDWLNQKVGGAESVLFELAEMYPKADIFTLVYNPKKFDSQLKERKVNTSRLQKFPSFIKKRPKLLLPFIKKSIEKWDFSEYDLVITSSSAWVKNINLKDSTKHVCYCYSPARMLWDSWPKYIYDQNLGPVARFYITRLASKLRLWDYYMSQRKIEFIAISKHVADRIAKFYHKKSIIIFPPVDLAKYKNLPKVDKKDFYLIVSVLAKYKNIELAIKAFKDSGKSLIIAGDGPDINRLKEVAGEAKNIAFEGRVSEHRKLELMVQAKGFIFCNVEDFGITMVESIAAGTGVVALRGGGAGEIVKESKTGIFYDEPNEESLNRAIVKYESSILKKQTFNNQYVFDEFSVEKFKKEFMKVINAQ